MKVNQLWKEKLEDNKEEINRIYNSLEDELSKKIYENLVRLHYTGDVKYLIETVRLNGFEPDPALLQYEKLNDWVSEGRPLILYGLGRNAQAAIRLAKNKEGEIGYLFFPFITSIKWTAYCDKNPEEVLELPNEDNEIISPEEMVKRYPDALVCVTSDIYYEEIKKELMGLGVDAERICQYIPGRTKVFEENQYFDKEFMLPQKEGYFVEGGAYCFDSAERFFKWNNKLGFEGLLSFEPDPVNFDICLDKLAKACIDTGMKVNSKIINAGLSDGKYMMKFRSGSNDESCFTEDGDIQVPLVTIDETVGDRTVSFIKLDVEGFELQALYGAQNTIKRFHPRIAVCAYHKKEDLLELPKWILDLNMGYRLRIRMYSNEYLEIVLYAI